jgi:hypothetical protein
MLMLLAGSVGSARAAFTTASSPGVGRLPHAVAVGDFNGDGNQDLATAHNVAPGEVSVLVGDGTGNFTISDTRGVGNSAREMAVGDFNGDGNQDLITASFENTGTVSVLRGDGTGKFPTVSTIFTGNNPFAVAVGDFNGDGKQDFVVTDTSTDVVTVHLGNGNGTFGGGTFFDAGDTPISLVVGDFNGDAKPDLAVSGGGAVGTVSVLAGAGDGTFANATPATTFGIGSNPGLLTMGDFNGDGRQDLAATSDQAVGKVSVLVGDGNGAFTSASTPSVDENPFSIAAGDFNGDGNQDLVTANANEAGTVSVLRGNGDGTFAADGSPTVGDFPLGVAVGDFNGDGNQDLATANHNVPGSLTVLTSTDPPAANLLAGGGAEGAGAAHTAALSPEPPGWTREQGNLTYVRYGTLGFPALLEAPPLRAGMAFFAGGPASAESVASQTVDVSSSARVIDQGRANLRLSGDLGGSIDTADHAQVTATLFDAGGAPLGAPLEIGPVSAADRHNVTTLLPRSTQAAVPAGTRRITVRITATGGAGTYNDGYADNLALVLTGQAVDPPGPGGAGDPGGTGGSAPAPGASTSLLVRGFGLTPSSFRAAGKGGPIGAAQRRRKAPVGTRIAYRIDGAAIATFTVQRPLPGVRKGKRCVAPPRKRRSGSKPKRCTRYPKVGAFSRNSTAGANSFRFTGRVKGKALSPGKYRLIATARVGGGKPGKPATKRFTIVR